MAELTEQQVIDQIADRLTQMYRGVEPAQVSKIVNEQYDKFSTSPIRDFVPLFVERQARTELARLAP